MARSRRDLWDTWNLDYFNALPTYRWCKRYFSYAAALAAAAWIAAAVWRGDETPYSSGPISVGHVAFADDCMRCHTPGRGYFHFLDDAKPRALNKNCLVCHGLTIAYDPLTRAARHQIATPGPVQDVAASDGSEGSVLACSGCHTEHRGYQRLVDMSDQQCVQCHADLKRHTSDLHYDESISSFHEHTRDPEQSHPEFQLLRNKTPDPGRIRFNHRQHLKPEKPILGPDNRHYRLRCDDCHRAGDSSLTWRFGHDAPHSSSRSAVAPSEPHLQRNYMDPINYSLHCAACHKLAVGLHTDQLRGDETTPRGAVPHSTPAAIRTYLRGQLIAYVNDPDRPAPPPGAKERTPLPKFADKTKQQAERLKLEWIEREVRRIEFLLYGQEDHACRHCHEIRPPEPGDATALPSVVKPDIPRRWFTSASFSHERHKALPGPPLQSTGWANCVECHESVLESTKTSDVLLPGIDRCRKCHAPRTRGDGVTLGGVSHSCVFCHTYHRPPARPAEPPASVGAGRPPAARARPLLDARTAAAAPTNGSPPQPPRKDQP